VVKVAPLPLDLLALLAALPHRFPPALAPLLAAGHTPLHSPQAPVGCAEVAGMFDVHPVRRDQEHLEAHVDAGFFAGQGQRRGGNIRA